MLPLYKSSSFSLSCALKINVIYNRIDLPNSYFNFKQFTIHQDRCAMKVCTDACLFAALVSEYIRENHINANTLLDIGAGTGLLSLMLAQQIEGSIDAVEIELSAFEQCVENIHNSPFSHKINVHHTPIQLYDKPPPTGYDFIISNPPFFEKDLKSNNAARNMALHDEGLTLNELMAQLNRLISPTGKCGILLPDHRLGYWKEICESNNWYIQFCCKVKQSNKHSFFRSIILMSQEPVAADSTTLIIKKDDKYTLEFKKIMSPFYLATL